LIEAQMVRRMALRGAVIAPFVITALGIYGGWLWAASAAIGLAMTIGNLWLAGRLIGTIAENSPHMLLPMGLVTFTVGLLLLTLVSLGLKAAGAIYFPVTGFVLIGAHLVLVLTEAGVAYKKIEPQTDGSTALNASNVRS
jgi:hypothetical protein